MSKEEQGVEGGEGEHWRVFRELRGRVDEVMATMEARLRQLDHVNGRWEEIQEEAARLAEKAPAKVKLNVGGRGFSTSRTTVMSFPMSLLAVVLSTPIWKPEDGVYFFDRNPRLFEVVLDYLRDGTIRKDEQATDHQRRAIERELDFFGIPYAKDAQGNLIGATEDEESAIPDPSAKDEAKETADLPIGTWAEELNGTVKSLFEKVEAMSDEAAATTRKLDRWRKMEGRVAALAEAAKDAVRVDFGGTVFVTTRNTLSKSQWFDAQLTRWEADEDGCYFIDRNPKFFDTILDYLRTGHWSIELIEERNRDGFEKEVDYFCLPPPEQAVDYPVFEETGTNRASPNNANEWQVYKVRTQPLASGKHVVTFKIVRKQGFAFMLGLAKPDIPSHGRSLAGQAGWSLKGSGQLAGQDKQFVPALKQADRITVMVDLDAGALHFAINDGPLTPAFGDVRGPVVPAVAIASATTAIEILSFTKFTQS